MYQKNHAVLTATRRYIKWRMRIVPTTINHSKHFNRIRHEIINYTGGELRDPLPYHAVSKRKYVEVREYTYDVVEFLSMIYVVYLQDDLILRGTARRNAPCATRPSFNSFPSECNLH